MARRAIDGGKYVTQIVLGAASPAAGSAVLTRDFFGVVENNGNSNFAADFIANSNLDKALVALDVQTLRYPGGTDARATTYDPGTQTVSTWADISSPSYIASLEKAIDYCALRGLKLDFTLNDLVYFDAQGNPGHLRGMTSGVEDLTAAEKTALTTFLTNDLLAYAHAKGVEIGSIRIGNEIFSQGDVNAFYGPNDHYTAYSRGVVALAKVMDAAFSSFAAQNAGFLRPEIVVEAIDHPTQSGLFIGKIASVSNLITGVDFHGAGYVPTLGLTWDTYFGADAGGTPTGNGALQDNLAQSVAVWTSAYPDIDLRVDAWSFPTGPSLQNAALGMLQFHTFSLLGISNVTNYTGYGSDGSALVRKTNGTVSTPNLTTGGGTAGGQLFLLMNNALRGMTAVDLASQPDFAAEAQATHLERLFAGPRSAVFYEVNRSSANLVADIDLTQMTATLEAFIGGVAAASLTVLGVSGATSDHTSPAQITKSTLTAAQVAGLSTLGATDFTLTAYQIAQVQLTAGGTFGTASSESLSGSAAADAILGLNGADTISGLGGSDKIAGGNGNDSLLGGNGNDTLFGGAGRDALAGGAGRDVASYQFATAGVVANLSNSSVNSNDAFGDTYDLIEDLAGSHHADTLTGSAEVNLVRGNGDDDSIFGLDGDDSLYGDDGADTLSGDAGNDRLYGGAGDDSLGGGDGEDLLIGSSGNDTLRGNAGIDSLQGDGGFDYLSGGASGDLLSGGLGADVFNFNFTSEGGDTVSDFASGSDRFHVLASGFGGGLAGGGGGTALSASQFQSAANHSAASAGVRFLYDTASRTLWFDADGSGASGPVLLATLTATSSAVVASDILLF